MEKFFRMKEHGPGENLILVPGGKKKNQGIAYFFQHHGGVIVAP